MGNYPLVSSAPLHSFPFTFLASFISPFSSQLTSPGHIDFSSATSFFSISRLSIHFLHYFPTQHVSLSISHQFSSFPSTRTRSSISFDPFQFPPHNAIRIISVSTHLHLSLSVLIHGHHSFSVHSYPAMSLHSFLIHYPRISFIHCNFIVTIFHSVHSPPFSHLQFRFFPLISSISRSSLFPHSCISA